jgi:hypothetical protein
MPDQISYWIGADSPGTQYQVFLVVLKKRKQSANQLVCLARRLKEELAVENTPDVLSITFTNAQDDPSQLGEEIDHTGNLAFEKLDCKISILADPLPQAGRQGEDVHGQVDLELMFPANGKKFSVMSPQEIDSTINLRLQPRICGQMGNIVKTDTIVPDRSRPLGKDSHIRSDLSKLLGTFLGLVTENMEGNLGPVDPSLLVIPEKRSDAIDEKDVHVVTKKG